MHAYLLIGNNQQQLKLEKEKLIKKLKSQPLDFTIKKIGEVRELANFLKLSVDKPTAIICDNVDNATIEALNAFLKILEEPQKNVYFILTAANEHLLLPTITSRCQIIRLNKLDDNFDKTLAVNFIKMTKSQRISDVSKIKKKEDAISYLKNLHLGFHQLLTKTENYRDLSHFLKLSQDTLLAINKNGNVNLQLTNFIAKS